MNHIPYIVGVVALALGTSVATAVPTTWISTHQSGATGIYVELVDAVTNRSAGSGFNNASDTTGNFVDFFDDTDTIEFQNVVIDLQGDQRLAIESRAGNRFHRVTLELFDSTQGTSSTPLHTFTADRFRASGFQNQPTAFTGNVVVPSGTYDIKLTSVLDAQGDGDAGNSNEGSHLFGLGTYVAPNILTNSSTGTFHILESTDAWRNGGSPQANTNRDANSTGGEWMDSLSGATQFLDWEVVNPEAKAEFTFSVRYRHAQSGTIEGRLLGIADDGTTTLLASVLLPSNGTFDGNFVDSATSSTFILPEGFTHVRFQEFGTGNNGISHIDFIQLNATFAIPEPATASLALLGLGGLMLRRRRMA